MIKESLENMIHSGHIESKRDIENQCINLPNELVYGFEEQELGATANF